jgi:ABC-type Na+ transport system ATPase subunit NatA
MEGRARRREPLKDAWTQSSSHGMEVVFPTVSIAEVRELCDFCEQCFRGENIQRPAKADVYEVLELDSTLECFSLEGILQIPRLQKTHLTG